MVNPHIQMQVFHKNPLRLPIVIEQAIQLYCYDFEEFDQKPAKIKFMCSCGNLVHLDLKYYMEGAFGLKNLYEQNILDKQSFSDYKIDKILADAIYSTFECPHCEKQFLMIYRVSEPNYNRVICQVAGVYNYKNKEE